jgi:DNA topoisomerase-1
MNYNFTADLEKDLDMVSEGQLNWVEGIDRFYQKLKNDLEVVKDSPKVELLVDKKCPECKNDLIQKYSVKTRGWFIGCKGYPDCKYTERIEDLNGEKKKDEKLDRKCPTCGEDLIKRYSPKTRSYFIGCSGYPKCKFIEAHKEEMGDCPMCGKKLIKRFSRKTRRFFVGCSGYPECKYIEKKSR